jgi:PPOX class probable F420-dependent enzyme
MRYLFEKRALAHLATLMPDGRPQVTPVWCDFDGRYVRINTAVGRQKDRNLARDGRVALSISDPDSPDRYLEVRGRVTLRTYDGADAHIDSLSQKYLGTAYPYRQANEQRVLYHIDPEHFTFMD